MISHYRFFGDRIASAASGLRTLIPVLCLLVPGASRAADAQQTDQAVPNITVKEAIEALRSSDQDTRRQGVVRLRAAELQEAKSAVPTIIEIIKQQAPEIPAEPLMVLATLGPQGKDAVPAIVANLEKYAPDVQLGLLHVVAAIGPDAKAALPSLITIATKQADRATYEGFHRVYLAYRAMGNLGPAGKPAVATLLQGLKSEIASDRRNAAAALGRLGGDVAPQAAPALIQAIGDPLVPIRDEAILALANFGDLAKPAIPRLRNIVKDVNSTQRAKAAMTLWVLTKDADFIVPRMAEHLQFGDLEWEAAQVLAAIGPAAAPAVPQLVQALSRDESVQLPVLEALGNIGPAANDALPAIRKLLESDEPAVRVYAQRAIKSIDILRRRLWR